MHSYELVQLCLFIALLAALTKPLGLYLCRVFDPVGKTFLDPALRPVERGIYRLLGIDPRLQEPWLGVAPRHGRGMPSPCSHSAWSACC